MKVDMPLNKTIYSLSKRFTIFCFLKYFLLRNFSSVRCLLRTHQNCWWYSFQSIPFYKRDLYNLLICHTWAEVHILGQPKFQMRNSHFYIPIRYKIIYFGIWYIFIFLNIFWMHYYRFDDSVYFQVSARSPGSRGSEASKSLGF